MGNRDVACAVAGEVRRRYVVPDLSEHGAAAVERAADTGAYDDLDGPTLVARLTADLRAVISDRHLSVRWSEEPRKASATSDWDDPAFLAEYWRCQDYVNQGIHRAERLPGNVGLLVVESLDEPEGTGHVVEAALSFVGRCDALILDVRESNGGAPSGVAFWISHFVEPPARRLVTVLDRSGAVTSETWTTPYVRAPRFVDQPLYVLTSSRTPSGAEELAYGLQGIGRALVVGETTVGAANPVDQYVVDPHVLVRVPTARVVHAATGGNWEGTGVTPDLPCLAQDALVVAHRHAAARLLQGDQMERVPADVRDELRRVVE